MSHWGPVWSLYIYVGGGYWEDLTFDGPSGWAYHSHSGSHFPGSRLEEERHNWDHLNGLKACTSTFKILAGGHPRPASSVSSLAYETSHLPNRSALSLSLASPHSLNTGASFRFHPGNSKFVNQQMPERLMSVRLLLNGYSVRGDLNYYLYFLL